MRYVLPFGLSLEVRIYFYRQGSKIVCFSSTWRGHRSAGTIKATPTCLKLNSHLSSVERARRIAFWVYIFSF